jgi:hypothetical protein
MLRRTLLVLASALLTVVLLESASHVVYRFLFGEGFSASAADTLRRERMLAAQSKRAESAQANPALLVPHPFTGFVYNPRLDPDVVRSRHTLPVSEWGFVDDKPPVRAPAPDEVTIGIFGGSVALWFSVHGVETLLEGLRAVPEFRGKRLVVVRTALGGYKQPQQLMALNYLLSLGAHFDVVVNIDGFNEIALAPNTHVPRGVFPFYPRDWPELLGQTGDLEAVRLVGRMLYLEELRAHRARQFAAPILRHSVFATTMWRVLDQRLAADVARTWAAVAAHGSSDDVGRRNDASLGPARRYATSREMYEDLVRMWRQSSLQMHQLATANGSLYVHFLQPNQYVVGAKRMTATERAIALLPGTSYELSVREGYPLLIEAGQQLRAHGVAFTDLTQVFRDVTEPLYIDNCCHFDRRGNRLVAHAIAAAIADVMARRR